MVFTFSFLLFPSLADASALTRPANNLGLVGYWSFDDGRGGLATDSSGSGNTGTLVNIESSDWINGKRGKAILFNTGDSDDYVDISPVADNIAVGNMSVSAWVKFNSAYNTGSAAAVVFRNGDLSSDNDVHLQFGNAAFSPGAGKLGICAYGSGFGCAASSNNAWNANQWYHIVGTVVSGGTLSLYLDGSLISTSTMSGARGSTAATHTTIGKKEFDISEAPFQGLIDEVRLYSRALSAAEVTALYNSGASKVNASQNTVAPENLVLWHTFDGAYINTTTSTDRSSQSNNGTLAGASGAQNKPQPAQGKLGQALKFDGTDDYVGISHGGVLAPSSSLSVSAWINKAAHSGDIVSLGSNDSYWALAGYFNQKIEGSVAGQRFYSDTAIPLNQWTHVVMTYSSDGSGGKIYINGILDSTPFTSTSTIPSQTYVNIGAPNMEGYFQGSIDDVRIYNKALSAAEVRQLYSMNSAKVNTSLAPTASSGLVLWHTFDGQYLNTTTSTDRSSQSNNGTLAGASGAQNKPQPAQGKIGQALKFDGTDDYVAIASTSANLDLTTFTIAWWMNTGSNNPYIFSNGIQNNNKGFQINTACNSLREICVQRNVVGDNEQIRTSDGLLWDQNTWVHVMVTVDGTTVGVYINGVNRPTTGSWSGSINSYAGTAFNIGARSTLSEFFPGFLDDVRIYNRILSATEALQLYNLGK